MIKVVIPMALLLSIVLIKKIPYIGGSVNIGLITAAMAALLMNGFFNPLDWLTTWVSGIDRIAWVIALSFFGSIYAETQVRMGTMETVINSLRAVFGKSPRGLVVSIMIALGIAGALLGDSIAAAAVVGVLIVPLLADIKMKPEEISATLIMGAGVGSIMPPISQAYILAIGLVGISDPSTVMSKGYFWTILALAFVSIYAIKAFIKVKQLPDHLIPNKTAGQILSEGWKTLIPLVILITIIVLRNGFKIDTLVLVEPIFKYIREIPILQGMDFDVAKAIILVTVIAFIYPKVHKNAWDVIKTGVNNVKICNGIQVCAGFMIGAFYKAGLIGIVKDFAMGLNEHILKIGGAFSMMLIGMLTGSQTTTQTTIFTFFGPAVIAGGVDPVNAALAGAHLATAGEGFPPVCLATFVVAGLVGGILGKRVNPLGSMFRSVPYCLYFLFTGILLLYL